MPLSSHILPLGGDELNSWARPRWSPAGVIIRPIAGAATSAEPWRSSNTVWRLAATPLACSKLAKCRETLPHTLGSQSSPSNTDGRSLRRQGVSQIDRSQGAPPASRPSPRSWWRKRLENLATQRGSCSNGSLGRTIPCQRRLSAAHSFKTT